MPHPYFDSKWGIVTAPAAIVDNSALTTTEIDTIGYDYCQVLVIVGATDIALTVMKVQESDTSGSGFADVTGLVASGTTGNERLPTATDDNGIFIFNIDLKARKRYLDAAVTVGDGTAGAFVTVLYRLFRAKEGGTSTASTMGLKGFFDA